MRLLLRGVAAAALALPCAGYGDRGPDHGFHGHCTVSAVTLTFGPYNPFRASHTDSTGHIAVSCAGRPGDAVSYAIQLSAGRSGTYAQRHMHGYSHHHVLNYNLYVGASRTLVWGDGNNGTQVVTDAFTQTPGRDTRVYPVYGRIFAGQNPHVGNYADAIVVTLVF